ncbi:Clp protease N-terminal domain-containing protein [Dactylosporangium sp. CA-233914]|uniref:Clp protease N-terminal domain-containing protein n=1 Tax=Dactylosporangium sp. CA-233914 TaxID=3239934 RepID=UPI003D8BAD49
MSLREALQLRHDHIGTEHLLLGLIRQGRGASTRILNLAGVDLGSARVQVERMPSRHREAPPATAATVAADGRHPGLGRMFMVYRRDDLAPSVSDDLDAAFCGTVLVLSSDSADLDSAQPDSPPTAAISECDVVLALIGPHWLSAVTSDGQRRIAQASDPVRTALEAALRLGKATVPALLGNVSMPRAEQLPTSLSTLLDGKPIRIAPGSLHEHIAGLMRLYSPPR